MLTRRNFSFALAAASVCVTAQSVTDVAQLSLAQAAARLQNKQTTSVALTEACISRIEVYQPKLTKTVEDAAILLNCLAGYDRLDIASVEHTKEDYLALMKQPVKPLRIGIPRVPYFDHLDADVAKSIEAAIAKVASLTSSIKDVNLPSPRGTSGGGEMYAYHQEFFDQGKGLYQIPVRRNLENGKETRAYQYTQASWKLQLLRRTIKRELSDKPRNPELENPADFNTFGIPALTLPCGFGDNDMPIGLMIVGPRFSEGKVLALAHAFEQATEWHKRKPPLRPDSTVPPLANTDEA